MPSKTGSKSANSANRAESTSNFVDDYLADWNVEDPFRSPSPPPAKNDKDSEKKKDVLGIDKELDLKRKPRVPRVKLDETRLLSDKGIPKLRKMAPRLKLKGKGHEFDDAARLLSFYQAWLDDLFPKATFLDALAMVEKAGHKTTMRNARLQWIDEGKPKAAVADDDDDEDNRIHSRPAGASRVAPVFENTANAAQDRARTTTADDLSGDDEIYNATPRRNPGTTAPSRQVVDNEVPDEDDLDALMAEADINSGSASRTQQPAPFQSIFGNGTGSMPSGPIGAPEDDDLDAWMAEAEAQPAPARPSQPTVSGNILSDGKSRPPAGPAAHDDGDDLDALMAEAEAQGRSQSTTTKNTAMSTDHPAANGVGIVEDDDLDALMAEAEAGPVHAGRPADDSRKPLSAEVDSARTDANLADDEEAMAEMDGLW